MFKPLEILEDSHSSLRTKSIEVPVKLSTADKKIIKNIIKHLTYSQIEDKAELYCLRPGMGLAFPQLGFNKRIIVIVHEIEEGVFDEYVVINPKVVSHSVELIAAAEGEGCLSVNREVEGHVPRFARVTIEGYDLDGDLIRVRAREELSIAFQHEIDHLDGILFYDRIDINKKFYAEDEIRLI